MTGEKLSNAITELDSDILDRYFKMKSSLEKKAKRRAWIKWTPLVAACLALVVFIAPSVFIAFQGAHSGDPSVDIYNSLDEVHDALGYDTLYSNLDLDQTRTCNISISNAVVTPSGVYADGDLQMSIKKPSQLLIQASYSNGELIDRVNYYIIFNKNSIDDGYIGGYEEQGLTKEINGITVHYSLIEDGAMHGQARFLYNGNLYIIDVHSWGDQYNLDTYLDMVFN